MGGGIFHLWWHPHDFGVHLAENLRAVRDILGWFARLRDAYGMESLTMAEAAERALGAGAVATHRPGAGSADAPRIVIVRPGESASG